MEEALNIYRTTGNKAGEAGTLADLAALSYQILGLPADAIHYLQEAITMLEIAGLNYTSHGYTIEMLQQVLTAIQRSDQRSDPSTKGCNPLWYKILNLFGRRKQ
jgi:hypothetical protein